MAPGTESEDTFQQVSLAPRIADSWAGAVLVLDTHIVSAIDGMAQKGYRVEHASHRRAANLLRRVWRERAEGLHHSLDTFEGGGFHRGGIESYNAVHRFASISSILALGPAEFEEFVESGRPIQIPTTFGMTDKIRTGLDETTKVLPWVFTPSYAMALALHVAQLKGLAHLEYICETFSNVSVIPDVAALSAILSIMGVGDLRGHIRDGIYLLRQTGKPKPIQAAAWDIAHLEYLDWLSLVKFGDKERLASIDPSKLILITEDKNLAKLGQSLVCPNTMGALQIRPGTVPQERLVMFQRMRERLQARNSINIDWRDEWLVYANLEAELSPIIRSLESELGLDHLSVQVWPMHTEKIETNWPLIYDLLPNLADQSRLIEFLSLETVRQEVLLPVLSFTVEMINDNARSRHRSVEESLVSTLLFERQSADEVLTGQSLVAAACQENPILLNAVFQSIRMDKEENFGPVLFVVTMVLKRFLEDTADANCAEFDFLIEALQAEVRRRANRQTAGQGSHPSG